jgi:limonene-1,2-epoxide hydrolase
MASLKDLEIAMRMENVEEMPIHHTTWCNPGDEESVLAYNANDVLATYKFLLVTIGKTDYPVYKGRNKIELRQQINKMFNIKCLNLPDVGMGSELMLQLYSRAVNKNPYEIKKLRTVRGPIKLKDCVPFWCNIKSKEFNKFLDIINNTTVVGEKKEFECTINFHGYNFNFGLGGSHGDCGPGVYTSDSINVIVDLDVSSLYPSIAKSLNLYPEHLGPEFMSLYSGFIEKRIAEKHKPKNERNNALIEGYKLILNGTYGKSNEDSSFMFDRLYTFKTTIAGQIFIAMWAERMYNACEGNIKFLQTNTDGQTILINRKYLDKIRAVNEQLTKETTLGIEEVLYSKMIMRDVNSYIAVYDDNTSENEHLKLKGCFEIFQEYHKDPSMRIVPMALKEYFVNNVPIRDTIFNHKDIYDFCLRLKTNSKSIPIYKYIDNNKICTKELNRTTRYYISNNGGSLFKEFKENHNIVGVNIGYSATLFNKFVKKEDFKDYNINYQFYIAEAMKIVNVINKNNIPNLFDYGMAN